MAGYPGTLVAGVDEVGRGCLAGPVVSAAVVLPPEWDTEKHPWVARIRDSKLLSPRERAELSPLIQGWVLGFAIGAASVEEIDSINILQATLLAMKRALDGLRVPGSFHVLVDGNVVPPGIAYPATSVIKGDQKSLTVATASVIAKTWRDELMNKMDMEYPGYGFGAHKGYSTKAHSEALRKLGITRIHRKSFSPVAMLR